MVTGIHTKMRLHTWAYVILLCCNYIGMIASVSMNTGKEINGDKNFTFPIAVHDYHPSSAQGYKAGIASWFVGTGETLTGEAAAYSISYATSGLSTLSPLLTSTSMIVNNVADQPNPLRGRPLAWLRLLGINPLVVPADNLSELILLNIAVEPHRILRVQLLDTYNKLAAVAGLVVLQNPMHLPDVVVVNPNMTIAAAVRPLAGVFGDLGSGLSMLMTAVAKNPSENNKKNDDSFKPEDLLMGVSNVISLDRMSPLIGINHPVSYMKNFVSLYASELLNKIFVGVNVTGNTYHADGVVSVLIAQIKRVPGMTIEATMEPVVSATAVGPDVIVAARFTGNEPPTVAAHALRTMRTSTGLDYLIVNGGVGADEKTALQVFALPIIRATGVLAHAHASPVTSYHAGMPFERSFVTLPEMPDDLYSSASVPAIVGAGVLPAPATDIVVSGDAVFVSTKISGTRHAPGLWHSQAIFGASGTIIAWTPWRRAGGAQSAVPIKSFAFDQHAAIWWLLTETNEARMTAWNASSSLSMLIKQLTNKQGSAHYLRDFMRGPLSPGLLMVCNQATTCIIQTDYLLDGIITPRIDFTNGSSSNDGTGNVTRSEAECSWLSISGGDLLKVGTITSSVIIDYLGHRWIMVAGTGGLAILAHQDGSGYVLKENFDWVKPDLAWHFLLVEVQGKPLAHVRKLIYDQGMLYILTSTGLFRMAVGKALLTREAFSVTTLATLDTLSGVRNSTFADIFMAGPLAFLATSVGCFRSGSGVNVATIVREDEAKWTKIELPYSPGPVVSISSIGPVAHSDHSGCDANLYVLSSSLTSLQARIYRLVISHTGVVTDDTVALLPDELMQGKRAFFLSIGDYRNRIVTDGSFLCALRNRYGTQNACIELYSPDWCTWPLGLMKSINIVRSAHRGIVLKDTIGVGSMVYSNGLGSWLVLADIGLISNE
jgi:hypothetical protein